jgi:hypothetical protein
VTIVPNFEGGRFSELSLEEVKDLMEEPKDKLTEEDLDQPVKSAGDEEEYGDEDEKGRVQHSTGHSSFCNSTPGPPRTGGCITRTLQRTRVSKLFDKPNGPSSLPHDVQGDEGEK